MTKVRVGAYTLTLSNTDKILFPEHNYTKGDVLHYYAKIAEYMLPFLKNRPLAMERYPNGIHGESFYQKDASPFFPSWIKTHAVEKKEGGDTKYIICQNKATLLYIANLACITPHLWLSKLPRLEYPDKLIFDLDPSPEVTFPQIIDTAFKFRDLLLSLSLRPYIMTTGSKGLHVVIPLDRFFTFEAVETFAQGCAQLLIRTNQELLTTDIRKVKRKGKIFIDTLRNQFGSLAVAPYAIRAKPGAPIATPVIWDELNIKGFTSQQYTLANIFDRMASIQNPWPDFFNKPQSLKTAHKLLIKLLNKY